MVQQLVLAEEEALVAALQQLVGLPAGDQAGLDQPVGDAVGVATRLAAGFVLQIQKNGIELALFDQPAPPQQIEKYV